MKFSASWITPVNQYDKYAPLIFFKDINLSAKPEKATLTVTAIGTYEARINGSRVSDYVFAPGWTQYTERIQYQSYDVTDMLKKKSTLEIEVAAGWARGRIARSDECQPKMPVAAIAQLDVKYKDGSEEQFITDTSWCVRKSCIVFSEIYDGETCDANFTDKSYDAVKALKWSKKVLIPQEGEEIKEHEVIYPTLFTAPNGEKILDYGQNLIGYVEISLDAHKGEQVVLDCAEVLDKDGNFYRENYRSAKSTLTYICKEGHNVYKPKFSFFGFRYLRLIKHPKGKIDPMSYKAICVYSDIKKTGYLNSSNKNLNQLFSNIFWGQKCNYLDIPTDCPQRDERLGWTGDAQVFARTASYNFDVEKFFTKWLHDLSAACYPDGRVSKIVPYVWKGAGDAKIAWSMNSGSAWGDAVTICPWEMYLTYGNVNFLKDGYEAMCNWINYITNTTKDKYLWTGMNHYGDWLGMDAPEGSYKGSSRQDLIASAYYAYSTQILTKASKILGKQEEAEKYGKLYKGIVKKFREYFDDDYKTQTEHAIALRFGLAKDMKKTAASLDKMIKDNGNKLTTGFVGTPYLLHALSENGYMDTAYTLLLQEEYPSWLFSVTMGATTMWEHWDGKKADGSFWSKDMNSFNHYAYGAVADWVYGVAAGINRVEDKPGFEQVVIAPHPDKRLEWLDVSIETKSGLVASKWVYKDDHIRYEITTPSPATIILGTNTHNVEAGKYIFTEKL